MKQTLPLAIAMICGMFLALTAFDAWGDTLERLLMPGDLIEGHAKFENTCKSCHEPFDKSKQRRLCLACHKPEARDISKKVGFHGRSKQIRRVECKQCHTDHKGRKADIVGLDRENFKHAATDFPLRGAHEKLDCGRCHRKGKKFRDAPKQCISCHRADEPHKGRMGKVCSNCHGEQRWSPVRFDHSKTKFPLKGAHRKTLCKDCHPNERYKNTPKVCASCHKLNDVHGGRYGAKCNSCHTPKAWTAITFDHGKHTKYPLVGKHRKVGCGACHTGGLYRKKLKKTCYGCHKLDDEHKGRNGTKCQACHTPRRWNKVAFNHNKDTKFALRGKHASASCRSCHKGNAYKQKLRRDCLSCHRQDDVHKGQQGKKCDSCHNETGWGKKVFFDHDLTRFPLIGLHATAPCEACHLTAEYKDASLQCVSCHQSNDVHKKRFGALCGPCHNPNGWALWRFEHNKQTRFVLDGAHKGLDCNVCHTRQAKKTMKLPKSCVSCHEGDDTHRGAFGRQCERCHQTKSFRDVRFPR
jgi:hypothetical protein